MLVESKRICEAGLKLLVKGIFVFCWMDWHVLLSFDWSVTTAWLSCLAVLFACEFVTKGSGVALVYIGGKPVA